MGAGYSHAYHMQLLVYLGQRYRYNESKVGPTIYGIVSIGVAVLHVPLMFICTTSYAQLGFDGLLKVITLINAVGLLLCLRLRE